MLRDLFRGPKKFHLKVVIYLKSLSLSDNCVVLLTHLEATTTFIVHFIRESICDSSQ